MIDAERMLGSLVRNAMRGGRGLGRRGRGKRGRKGLGGAILGGAGKGALALGALGVAMAAFEHLSGKQATASQFSGSRPAPPPASPPAALPPLPPLPTGAPPPPPPPPQQQQDALLLVRAMIAAANADHELDAAEQDRILDALAEAEASEEDKAFLLQEIEEPIDLAALAASATTPELASQIYLASCLAIDVDTRAERNYLDRLARRLGLEPERARELERLTDDG